MHRVNDDKCSGEIKEKNKSAKSNELNEWNKWNVQQEPQDIISF